MPEKTRVNVTLDKHLLEKAKTKLDLFGGKLSTLFNVFLKDFVKSMDQKFDASHKDLLIKIKDIDSRLKKLERN